MNNVSDHDFDLEQAPQALDLFAEELPEQVQRLSDCLATGTTFSSVGGCIGSFSTIGSVVSCG